MGNSASHRLSASASTSTGKVILSNGAVFTYETPLTVAELMLEYPQQVVAEFQPVMKGKKPTPLPADHKLEMNKLYFMLPIRKGGKPSQLSSEEARKLLVRTNSMLKSKSLILSYTGFLPLFVRICPAAAGKHGAVSIGEKKKEEECLAAVAAETIESDCFSEVLEGRPEFLSRQISGKGWKPSLDTITEKAANDKVRHWMF